MSALVFRIVRRATLGASCLLAIAILGMAAQVTHTALQLHVSPFYFAKLAIASSSITTVTLPVMLYLDWNRTGAYTSFILTEVVWLSVLWIVWLGTAADAAMTNRVFFTEGCGFQNRNLEITCGVFPSITAFSFIIWLILMAYSLTLLGLSVVAHMRGYKVWFTTVKQGFVFEAVFQKQPVFLVKQRQHHQHQYQQRQKQKQGESQLYPFMGIAHSAAQVPQSQVHLVPLPLADASQVSLVPPLPASRVNLFPPLPAASRVNLAPPLPASPVHLVHLTTTAPYTFTGPLVQQRRAEV